MRMWIRLGLVALIILLGVRAWVLRSTGDAEPAADEAPAAIDADTSAGATAAAVLSEALSTTEEPGSRQMAWRVTRLNWADGILVLNVEANDPDDARAIAEQIVEPLDDGYDEVLIYVSAPEAANDPVLRRVRWTPDEGYVETSFAER